MKSNFFWKKKKQRLDPWRAWHWCLLAAMCAIMPWHEQGPMSLPIVTYFGVSHTSGMYPLPACALYHNQKWQKTVCNHKEPDLFPFIHLPVFRKVVDILHPRVKAQEIPPWQPKRDGCSSSIPLQSAKIWYYLIHSRVRNPWGLTDLLEQPPAPAALMGILLAWDLASSSFPQNLTVLLTTWRGFITFLLNLFLWLHVNDLFHNRYGRFRS